MDISGLISIITEGLERARIVLQQIPAILLLCTCTRRSGLSSIIMSAKIYADMNYAENENDEIVKQFVFNVIDRIKQNIHDDGVCFIVIPPGELRVQLVGGNAGGPVTLDGTNTNFVFAWGIIR